MSQIHVTKNGERIPVSKLENGHLKNIIAFIEHRAEGGGEVVADVEWYSEEHLLEIWNYQAYINGYNRRLNHPNEVNK